MINGNLLLMIYLQMKENREYRMLRKYKIVKSSYLSKLKEENESTEEFFNELRRGIVKIWDELPREYKDWTNLYSSYLYRETDFYLQRISVDIKKQLIDIKKVVTKESENLLYKEVAEEVNEVYKSYKAKTDAELTKLIDENNNLREFIKNKCLDEK